MAIPTWPVPPLPELRWLVDSGQPLQIYAPLVATEFDDGPVRQRRRALYDEAIFGSCALMMSVPQFTAFLAFYRNDLNRGARWFRAHVRGPSGAMAERACQIRGGFTFTDLGIDQGDASRRVVLNQLAIRGWA